MVTSICEMDILDNTCTKGLKQKKKTSPSNYKQSN